MTLPSATKLPFYIRGGRISPLFDSIRDFQDVSQQVAPIVRGIVREKHVRHAVIDTWCLVDFLVRRNLVLLLDIAKFETPDFDPKFDLLPRSFEELLKCLESFCASQMQLPSDVDPFDKAARIPTHVIVGLSKDKKLMARFDELLGEYYAKENLAISQMSIVAERRPKNLSGAYRAFIKKIDKKWFIQARRLNKARNLAAHSMSDVKVAATFGISGRDPIFHVRRECLGLLAALTGVKRAV